MKILIINTVPFRINGMSRIILDYYAELKNKVKFDFVANDFIIDELREKISKESRIFVLPNRKKKLFSYIIELKKIVSSKNTYDIVHIHGNSSLMAIEQFVLSKIVKKTSIKIIVHCHGSRSDYGIFEKITRHYFYRHYDKALTVELNESHLFKNRTHEVLPNGIIIEQFEFNENNRIQLRNQLNLKDETVLLHVGRMTDSKNHSFILKVFQKYLLVDEQAKLILIGDGPLKREIVKEIKELKVEQSVFLLGNKSNTHEWYSAADLFVLPSAFESFGLVAIEAQANSLPCVFSEKIPTAAQISEHVKYLPTTSEFLDEWVKAILELKNERRTALLLNERIKLGEFNIKNTSNKLMKIYEETAFL